MAQSSYNNGAAGGRRFYQPRHYPPHPQEQWAHYYQHQQHNQGRTSHGKDGMNQEQQQSNQLVKIRQLKGDVEELTTELALAKHKIHELTSDGYVLEPLSRDHRDTLPRREQAESETRVSVQCVSIPSNSSCSRPFVWYLDGTEREERLKSVIDTTFTIHISCRYCPKPDYPHQSRRRRDAAGTVDGEKNTNTSTAAAEKATPSARRYALLFHRDRPELMAELDRLPDLAGLEELQLKIIFTVVVVSVAC